jgi:hypothetical protein
MRKEKKENELDFIYNNNIGEKVPFIDISSKSSSSKNQNSKTSSSRNKLLLTQNSNNLSSISIKNHKNSLIQIMRKKLFRKTNMKKSNGILTFTEISISRNKDGISLNVTQKSKLTLSECKKGIKIGKEFDNQTPKKEYDKSIIFNEKLKNKKKAVLSMDNIDGKNLMDKFANIYANITTETKNINRVSSDDNTQNNAIKSNNKVVNVVNTNKSWNKNKSDNKYNKIFIKNKNEINNRSIKNNIIYYSNRKNKAINSSITNFKTKFTINSDLKNLINKYRPKISNNHQKSIAKNNNNPKYDDKNKNIKKKISFEKKKETPKTDKNKRNCSLSYLKIRESVKNLFQDNKCKKNEMANINKEMRRTSVIQTKYNNMPIISNFLRQQKNKQENNCYKILNNNNNITKIKTITNKNTFENIKNVNNLNYLKYKNEYKKSIQPNNKMFKYKTINLKKQK